MTVKLFANDKIAKTSSKGNQEKWFDETENNCGISSTNSDTKH